MKRIDQKYTKENRETSALMEGSTTDEHDRRLQQAKWITVAAWRGGKIALFTESGEQKNISRQLNEAVSIIGQ